MAILYVNQMPRGLAEPAHISKYPCTACSLIRMTLCTLPPPPHYTHPPPLPQPGTQAGMREHKALANAPNRPIPPQNSGQPCRHWTTAVIYPKKEQTWPEGCPTAPGPQFKAINQPCTFLHHIPGDHMAWGEWKQLFFTSSQACPPARIHLA